MVALMALFLLAGRVAEDAHPNGRVVFHFCFGGCVMFLAYGLLGSCAVALMGLMVASLARLLKDAPPSLVTACMWVFAVACMELVSRLLGDHPHVIQDWHYDQGIKFWTRLEDQLCGDALKKPLPNSELCFISKPFLIRGLAPWFTFRFLALKLISLGLDSFWAFRDIPSAVRNLENKVDLVRRAEVHLSPEKYGLRYCFAYLGYPPLFFTGPILTYNAFVSQLESEQRTYQKKEILAYCARLLVLMFGIEVFSVFWWYSTKLHTLTCSATDKYGQCIFDDLSVWELYIGMHVRLHFTWMALMIIWRFGRYIALLDGIDSPENMLGCVSFNYTFEAFWRIWHASMNRFMMRYLYVPLGGKERSWLAVPLVFFFVAYWHERTGFWTQRAWYAWAALNAAGVTIEKYLASLGTSLRGRKGMAAAGICFLARGLGPVALVLVNVPAIFYETSPRFYSSLLLRGWQSAALVVTLVLTFGCTGLLVDALRGARKAESTSAPRFERQSRECELSFTSSQAR
ncbi:unnamed protein product [Effrenium voratum]|nr:unnamed protein product [Effrenium voratum]